MSDYGDLGAAAQQYDLNIFLAERKYKSAKNTTTQIIEDGIVYCEDCGKPIPENRLKAIPHATRCVACQTEYEQSRQQ